LVVSEPPTSADRTGLSPVTVLWRAADVSIHAGSDEVTVRAARGETIHCGPRGLAILEAFSAPTSFSEAVEHLWNRDLGLEDYMYVTGTIASLHTAGVLVGKGAGARAPRRGGYSDPSIHIRMLADRDRTDGFISALRRVVRPGDVVVDVGTGTGVLATTAALAGARRVYAVEASGIADVAREVFELNGVSDRVTLVEGWSTQVELPEPADVFVSEMVGDEPLAERLLEVTLDARTRFVHPDARLVPERIRISGYAVALPEAERRRLAMAPSSIDEWRSWYAIDFSPLRAASAQGAHLDLVDARTVAEWDAITEAVHLVTIDLGAFETPLVEATTSARAAVAGRIDAFVVSFDLELADSITISTDPSRAGGTHWRTPVWLLADPISVDPGDTLRVVYRYRVPGIPDGVEVRSAAPSRRASRRPTSGGEP
jgi:protein arginine N-methyltransferase 1